MKNQTLVWLISGALVSFGLVISAGNTAPGITFDSRNYLYAAESLYQKGILVRENNVPFVEYAPTYPFFLLILRSVPFDFLQTIVWVQTGLMALSVFWFGKICFPFFHNKLIFSIFYIFLVFGSPLLLVYHFIWTESLFVSQSVLLCWFLLRFAEKPESVRYLISVIGLGAWMCMTRYAGVFFMPGVALALFLLKNKPLLNTKDFWETPLFLKTAFHALFYLFLIEFPVMLWWIRNKILFGQVMSDFSDRYFVVSVQAYFWQFNNIFTSWFLPDELPVLLRMVLIYGSVVGLVVWGVRQGAEGNKKNAENPQLSHQTIKQPLSLITFSLFIGYFLLVFPVCTFIAEFIDDRILAPIYLFGIASFFLTWDNFHYKLPGKIQKILLVALVIWGMYPVARGVENVKFWNRVSKVIPVKISKK